MLLALVGNIGSYIKLSICVFVDADLPEDDQRARVEARVGQNLRDPLHCQGFRGDPLRRC